MDSLSTSLPYRIGAREDECDVPGLRPEDMTSEDVPGFGPEDVDGLDVPGLRPENIPSDRDVPGFEPADKNSADVPGLGPEDINSEDVPGLPVCKPEDLYSADVPGVVPEDIQSERDVPGFGPEDKDGLDVPGLRPADINLEHDVPGLLVRRPVDMEPIFLSDVDVALILSRGLQSSDTSRVCLSSDTSDSLRFRNRYESSSMLSAGSSMHCNIMPDEASTWS